MTEKPMQKTEIPGICKVGEGVLINTDRNALAAYKARKEKDRRIKKMEDTMQSLQSDLSEIKNLLKGLVK